MPPIMVTNMIDQAQSPHYAVGDMSNKIEPRLAMVTHLSNDEELIPEILAGIRAHYSGSFQFGAPDVVVVDVTKDAVRTRKAATPSRQHGSPSPRDAVGLFDRSTDLEVRFPNPRHRSADVLEQDVRDRKIDRSSTTRPTCIASRSPFPEGLRHRCPLNRPEEAPRAAGQTDGRAGETSNSSNA